MRILLITGGWSAERDVALSGAKVLQKAMEELGHTVELYDLEPTFSGFNGAVSRNEFAFINLHGAPGEDGLVQAILEQMDFPFQGSGAAASMLALDKAVAKTFFKKSGLRIANSLLLTEMPAADWKMPLTFPVFIKDNHGGSTLNLEYVASEQDFFPTLTKLFSRGGQFLVEEAIRGDELTCGVYEDVVDGATVVKPLPPILIEVQSGSGLFDYDSKYSPNGAKEICPAPVSEELTRKLQDMAIAAHLSLGLSGYSRADFIVPEDGNPVILEVNTLPGMTARSLIPQEFAAIGVSFNEMVTHMIAMGMKQWRENSACKKSACKESGQEKSECEPSGPKQSGCEKSGCKKSGPEKSS